MKIKTALLLFFLALVLLCGPAVAEASGTVVRIEKKHNVQVNSTVGVDIYLENPSTLMVGGGLDILYDPSVVRVTRIVGGPIYSGYIFAPNLNHAHTGKVSLGWMGLNPVSTSGVLCTVYFEIRSSGSTELTLDRVELARLNGVLPRTVVNGFISTSSGSPYELAITSPQNLPTRNAGSSYSYTFSASGGSSPYTWSRLSGNLPPGLSLSNNGVLSGTPHQAGLYTFTLQLADNAGLSVNKAFSLTITGSGSTTDPGTTPPEAPAGAPAGAPGSRPFRSINISHGTLDTRLGPENMPVTLVVDRSMLWVNVSAILAGSGDRLRINNESLSSGAVKKIPLTTGNNSIEISIAPGGGVYQNITITIFRL